MILTYRHKALRQTSESVILPDEELRSLIDLLDEGTNGLTKIGLAANQIGVLKRVGVIKFSPEVWNHAADESNKPNVIIKHQSVGMTTEPAVPQWPHIDPIEKEKRVVLINPEIISLEHKYKVREGCLSYPGVFATIERYKTCMIKNMKLDGTYEEFEARGLLAQACQHEIDHMDGKTFEDHFDATQKFISANKIKRIKGTKIYD